MRALALHADILVFVSDVWQTTCAAVRGGDEGFVIDSPVYPEELRALPEVLEHAGFPASGLLATHGDWDHLLGRIAFPGAALGCAEATAQRLSIELGEAQRRLRAFDAEHYVEDRAPLSLGSLQPLPVPGRLELGSAPGTHELELHLADGHTADGVAYWLPWARALVCGDYLSPVEIPMLSAGGSLPAYRATLERLAPLVDRAEWVIPGHGAPVTGERAQEILAADEAYLDGLEADPDAAGGALPEGRATAVQRRIHDDNVRLVTGG
ncbi:MAG TPA: MBL fold metallo-hydrolase [Solirubrobacteraceae bacterium]|jgi:glyoxylase-like metal-dependent hydrolase (beta-lactamase superfamily II)|nr:MBL fold metallo-hydrolase [Solirubrobacteraceae bacterium]